jgi:transcription elongation factor Elf1
MPLFKCRSCGKEQTVTQVKFVPSEGKLVPSSPIMCELCQEAMEMVPNDFTTEISVSQNRFNSMSKDEQKDVLKKRSRAHYNKVRKGEVEQKRHDTIEHIKQTFTKGYQK